MVVFVTELTVTRCPTPSPRTAASAISSTKDLLLDHRKAALQQELAAEQRRHGGV